MGIQERVSAFTTKNVGIVNRLLNDVTVKYNEKSNVVKALWDTGATGTCISYDVVNKLSLIATGKKNIQTPSGTGVVNTYLIDIQLPNNVNIKDVEVCDSEIGSQGIDVLIGMDIINLGDLSVSNYNNATVFSFRLPSSQTTDYVKQIAVQNIIGTPHGPGKRKNKKK